MGFIYEASLKELYLIIQKSVGSFHWLDVNLNQRFTFTDRWSSGPHSSLHTSTSQIPTDVSVTSVVHTGDSDHPTKRTVQRDYNGIGNIRYWTFNDGYLDEQSFVEQL